MYVCMFVGRRKIMWNGIGNRNLLSRLQLLAMLPAALIAITQFAIRLMEIELGWQIRLVYSLRWLALVFRQNFSCFSEALSACESQR